MLYRAQGKEKGQRERSLFIALIKTFIHPLCPSLPPSITLSLLNHSPPISAGFIHGYYLAPRLNMKHAPPSHFSLNLRKKKKKKKETCAYPTSVTFLFLLDQLDGSRSVKRLYERELTLTHATRHSQMKRTHRRSPDTVGQPALMQSDPAQS